MRGLALLGLVLAIAGLPASRTPAGAFPPLLTYAVSHPVGQIGGEAGLCATAPAGQAFRISDPQEDRAPAWSPNGRLIAFEREETRDPAGGPANLSDIFVTNPQGRHLRNVTRLAGANVNYGPSWSPDGTKLAFVAASHGGALEIVNGDGTGATVVVAVSEPDELGRPSWSPDGQRLLYSSVRGANLSAVYVVGVDGRNEQKLIDSATDPVWSPDGGQIAYLAVQGGAESVAVADADGSNQRVLRSGESLFGHLAWSPDGAWIAFGSRQGTSLHLMMIRPDGSGEHPASTGGVQAYDPAWRPAGPPPTDRRPCFVRGTSKNDVLVGTDRGDLIIGGKGEDVIRGRGGDDVLVGGGGHDRLEGGRGDDVLVTADGGRDYALGGPGKDSAVIDRTDRLRSIEYRYR